jgi:hypothetical protein
MRDTECVRTSYDLQRRLDSDVVDVVGRQFKLYDGDTWLILYICMQRVVPVDHDKRSRRCSDSDVLSQQPPRSTGTSSTPRTDRIIIPSISCLFSVCIVGAGHCSTRCIFLIERVDIDETNDCSVRSFTVQSSTKVSVPIPYCNAKNRNIQA